MIVENSINLIAEFAVFGAFFVAVMGFVFLIAGMVEGLMAKLLVILGIFICALSINLNFDSAFNSTEAIHDNPVNISKDKTYSLTLDKNVLNEKIAESVDAERATVNDREHLLKDLRNGEIVSFDAVGDGKDLSGKVYFTKTDMVVLISDISKDNEKTIKVPME